MSVKYTYWMDEATFTHVRSDLEAEGIKLTGARKAVCLPLSRKISHSFVPPDAWHKFDLCRRQLSWYRTSRFAGRYLVVTDTPLSDYGIELIPETVIEKLKFKPKDLPGKDPDKMAALYQTPAFHDRCPEEFLDIGAMGEADQEKWLKVMGIRGITYQALFREQCANHANFIVPKYYLE